MMQPPNPCHFFLALLPVHPCTSLTRCRGRSFAGTPPPLTSPSRTVAVPPLPVVVAAAPARATTLPRPRATSPTPIHCPTTPLGEPPSLAVVGRVCVQRERGEREKKGPGASIWKAMAPVERLRSRAALCARASHGPPWRLVGPRCADLAR